MSKTDRITYNGKQLAVVGVSYCSVRIGSFLWERMYNSYCVLFSLYVPTFFYSFFSIHSSSDFK